MPMKIVQIRQEDYSAATDDPTPIQQWADTEWEIDSDLNILQRQYGKLYRLIEVLNESK